MTQLQLQNLIVNSLGPLVDEAIRTAGPHPVSTTFSANAQTLASWSHLQRLRYYIDVARHNGDLPSAPTGGGLSDESWPNTDWATIVTT